MNRIRVGVIFGGRSGEHEISLRSAESVIRSLDSGKYDVIPIGITHEGKWLSPRTSMALLPPKEAIETTLLKGVPAALTAEPDPTGTIDVIDKVNDVIGKVTLFAHYGHQSYRNHSDLSYDDWKVGGSFDLLGLTVGLYGTGTNANAAPYTNIYGRNTARDQFVAYVQKTF